MADPFEDETAEYCVLINEERQYSLWPRSIDIPAGWTSVGPTGARKDCLAYIEEHWIDMRPKSLVEQTRADTTEAERVIE